MTTRAALPLCILGTILAIGCNQDPGPPERLTNGIAGVDESLIRAALSGDDVEIELPLRRFAEGEISGRIVLRLIDVSEASPRTLGRAEVPFRQSTPMEHHALRVEGAGAGLERVDTAPIVIDWTVQSDSNDLFGKRSLFAALGNLDVSLRGPTELEGESPLRVVVRDPISQAPVAGAEVTAVLLVGEGEEQVSHELFEGTTDARGELLEAVALPDGVDAGAVRVTVAHETAQVWATRRVTRRNDGQMYLSSDKTIYKPGQEVQLRLLALEGVDRAPVADTEVVFEARDGRGNKVFKRGARTDAFGVASIAVPIDSRVNEGDWRFTALIGERRADLDLPVERYNLPRIQVRVTGDREFVLPGQRLGGRVDAQYLFGEPVIGGSVVLTAQTATGAHVGTMSGTTDDEGGFAFELEVPEYLRSEALEDRGDTLLMTAQVVDTAGQEEAGQGGVVLAAAPIRIHLIPDHLALADDGESVAYLVVTDPMGRPLRADLSLDGAEVDALATDASGVAELRYAGEGFDLEVTALDGAGRTHTRSFTLGGETGPRVRVAAERRIYRPGETATFRVAGSPDVSRVYLDVYRGARGVLSAEVDLVGGEAELRVPITDELGGLLVVDALALLDSGDRVRSTSPVLVERDDRVRVTIAPDRETYGPGDEATLEVRVTDAAGDPQVASVGLTVVDEAAFVLGGEPTTSIGQVFGLDPRVLPPTVDVAGRGPADLLAVEDDEERELLARLLFARAGEVAAPSFDYNSMAEELPRVVSSLSARVQIDAQALLEDLQMLADNGRLTRDNAASFVATRRRFDPFARPYALTVERGEWDQLLLVAASDGPDERPDTRDDVTVRLDMDWIFWGGGGGIRGGAGPAGRGGEPAPEAAFDAAGNADGATMEPGESGGAAPTKVRADFRETALVRPTLVTDASGRATVSFPLPHSITTWRASADGSTTAGRVGTARQAFRTFQSFFVDFTMPTTVTNGDILELPAVVYNYEPEAKSVVVEIDEADWFELLTPASQVVALEPSEVRSVKFRIRVTRAGEHALTLRGSGEGIADALVRVANVDPDGEPEDESFSGQLNGTVDHTVTIPADTVEGGTFVTLSLTPGFAAEAVQGLESLVQEPNGCFEQTTSTAWPNTLVASYLRLTDQMTPEIEEELIGVVTRGYQRLLTFESPTGGFNWWGDADPGNRILSAIMLWHLKDLEALIEIDTDVRDRTLDWLVAQQQSDGSWAAGDALHSGNEVLGTSEIRSTAFIAWALAHTGWAEDAVVRAGGYLSANMPPAEDLYANALAANALVMADRGGAMTTTLLGRLDEMRVDLEAEDGILWPTEAPSWTGAAGDTASLETTGLVAYGMMQADAYPADVAGAMRFIVGNKDAVGTWYNTQATMNALRALSAAASPRGSEADGTLTVTVNGVALEPIEVTPDNGDVLRTFDLSDLVRVGDNTVALDMAGEGEVTYRLTRVAYRPALPAPEGPLTLTVEYDRTETEVGVPVTATVVARNGDRELRNQVMVRVGRAPGFSPRVEDLQALVAARLVSRYEVRADDVTFYLMAMEAGEERTLQFRLTPGLAVEATAPASEIYPYYEPTLRQLVEAERFIVR